MYIYIFIYIISVFFHRHWRFIRRQGKRGDYLSFRSATSTRYEHWDIYLQLRMWGDYHTFLIATLVFTRLLLDEIYHLIELPFIAWLMMQCLFGLLEEFILRFCHSDFTWGNGGFELTLTITLVLQANRLTKCAGQYPNFWCQYFFGIVKRLM